MFPEQVELGQVGLQQVDLQRVEDSEGRLVNKRWEVIRVGL